MRGSTDALAATAIGNNNEDDQEDTNEAVDESEPVAGPSGLQSMEQEPRCNRKSPKKKKRKRKPFSRHQSSRRRRRHRRRLLSNRPSRRDKCFQGRRISSPRKSSRRRPRESEEGSEKKSGEESFESDEDFSEDDDEDSVDSSPERYQNLKGKLHYTLVKTYANL